MVKMDAVYSVIHDYLVEAQTKPVVDYPSKTFTHWVRPALRQAGYLEGDTPTEKFRNADVDDVFQAVMDYRGVKEENKYRLGRQFPERLERCLTLMAQGERLIDAIRETGLHVRVISILLSSGIVDYQLKCKPEEAYALWRARAEENKTRKGRLKVWNT